MEWTKQPNETNEQFIFRICSLKDSSGMTWPQIADVINAALNQNFGESAYRKRYQHFQNGLKACEKQIFTNDEYLKEVQKQTDELYKVKKQVQDQRREYRKMLTIDARAAHLMEELTKVAHKMNTEKQLASNGECYCETEHEAVLVLTDWHYGLVTDNVWNQYNTNICKQRLSTLLAKTKQYCRLHNVGTLNVIALGDLIHGSIHSSCRVASEEHTCDQIMNVSELLAEFLNDVSCAVNEVYFCSTYGNHARTVQNKNDSIHADNMEKIIPWWIKQRLQDNDKICVVENNMYEFICLNILGHDVIAVHGDLESFNKLGVDMHTLFNKKYGLNVEYVFSGDKHHFEYNDPFGIENVMVSSLCGTDEYANNKRLYSKPGQTLCIFNHNDGKICTYNIKF